MKRLISSNLAKPGDGIVGFIITKILTRRNRLAEAAAAQFCNIQPDDQVLEVGYGPGIGLKEAYNRVSEGSGTVHGIEISQRMFDLASKNLKQEIAQGKIKLQMASVMEMPYDSSTFDCIFHCNCYYFWPDMDSAIKELHRVIKADKVMVCTLYLSRLEEIAKKGFMQCGNIDPHRYMRSLENNGFYDVHMKNLPFENRRVDAIFATARK